MLRVYLLFKQKKILKSIKLLKKMSSSDEIDFVLIFKDKNLKLYLTFNDINQTFLDIFSINGIEILSPLVVVVDKNQKRTTFTLDSPLSSLLNQPDYIHFHQPLEWQIGHISLDQYLPILKEIKIKVKIRTPNFQDIINICSYFAQKGEKNKSFSIGRDIFRIFYHLGLSGQLIDRVLSIFCALCPEKLNVVVVQRNPKTSSHFRSFSPKDNISYLFHPSPQIILVKENDDINTQAIREQCFKHNILIMSTKLSNEKLSELFAKMTKEDFFALVIKHQPTIIWELIRKIFLYNKHIINNIK